MMMKNTPEDKIFRDRLPCASADRATSALFVADTHFKITKHSTPVWRESSRRKVNFQGGWTMRQARRIYRSARRFERQTRLPGRQDGKVTRAGLAVLYSLLFDFLNFKSGRLDPSYETIAKMAGICRSSVAKGLAALKAAGILHWVRRCADRMVDGRWTLEQETNAYGVLSESQWRGYKAIQKPPKPEPGTWGEPEALTPANAALAVLQNGGSMLESVNMLLTYDWASPVIGTDYSKARSTDPKPDLLEILHQRRSAMAL